jgi:hypothetical protein
VTGEWVEIPNPAELTDAQLETASDGVGAMTFVRPEDGAFNPNNRRGGWRHCHQSRQHRRQRPVPDDQ